MKILVTGGTGFVGKSLVPALLLAGHEVRCAVRQKQENVQAQQVIINSLELQEDWSEALEGIDVVIHMAARVHIMKDKSEDPLARYCEVNSTATQRLAEQASKHGVKRFVFLSSIKVNGEFTLADLPFTEDNIVEPQDPYGQSKLYAEQHLQSISQNTSMEFVVLRPPLIYGPGVKANFLKMIQLVNKGWPLPFAKVKNRRHFIYIDNLISAISAVIDDPKAANQVYLIADEEPQSLAKLLNLIANAMNVNIKLLPVPVNVFTFVFKLIGLSDLNTRLFGSLEVNTDKIKTQLGWIPPVSSVEGLNQTVKWYQNEFNT